MSSRQLIIACTAANTHLQTARDALEQALRLVQGLKLDSAIEDAVQRTKEAIARLEIFTKRIP